MDAGGIDDLSRTVVANQIFGARELRVVLARQLNQSINQSKFY
jgi:hypothetical protein